MYLERYTSLWQANIYAYPRGFIWFFYGKLTGSVTLHRRNPISFVEHLGILRENVVKGKVFSWRLRVGVRDIFLVPDN